MMSPFVPFPLIILSAGLYSNHGLLKPPHTHVCTHTHTLNVLQTYDVSYSVQRCPWLFVAGLYFITNTTISNYFKNVFHSI